MLENRTKYFRVEKKAGSFARLGGVAGGAGVLGLQRAFQTAGARGVVTSLWKVDDEAMGRLMEL
jgi:hypothetical protein